MPQNAGAYKVVKTSRTPARDSLELASLASSSPRDSVSSSASGPPSSRRLSIEQDDPLHTIKAPRPGHSRGYSISSAFDFAPPLFPHSGANGYAALGVSSTTDHSLLPEAATLEKIKTLTYLNGLSLIVGLIIGSGIFSAPSQVNLNAGSPGASLVIWVFAGILAWTGAASYAELGGAIPLNGGAQTYLTKIFGDLAGFLFSWCSVGVLKPGSAAIIAIIFGEYITRAVVGPEARDVSAFMNKGVAILGLITVTMLNAVSTRFAARAADFFLFFKFFALLTITVVGIVVAVTGFSWNNDTSTDWKSKGWFEGTNMNLSNLAVAVYAGLWAFDGWDNVNFVTGELVNPTRDLPRIIHTALPLVITSYLLANTAYFLVLPLQTTSTSTTIAVAFGSQVFGAIGALILALMVSGSCFGALNASTFTSSRLFHAAAKEGYLPEVFGTVGFGGRSTVRFSSHATGGQRKKGVARFFSSICSDDTANALFLTPMASLALNFAITSFYIVVGSFGTLVTFYGVAGYSFYFLTVLGLLVLRVKEPQLERPYRCWITTPIIFCCVSLFLLSRSIVAEPLSSLSVVGFVMVGAAIHYVKTKGTSNERQREGSGWRFWKRWGRE